MILTKLAVKMWWVFAELWSVKHCNSLDQPIVTIPRSNFNLNNTIDNRGVNMINSVWPHCGMASVNPVIICSVNALLAGWWQAIIWATADLLLIESWGTNFDEIWIKNAIFIEDNAFENVVCKLLSILCCVNSSPPSAAYMHQWIVSALFQLMACRLYGTKPLSEPMLDYYQLDPWEQSSVK